MEFLIVAALGIGAWFILRKQSPNDALPTGQSRTDSQKALEALSYKMIAQGDASYDEIKTWQHLWNLSYPNLPLDENGSWDGFTSQAFASFTGVNYQPTSPNVAIPQGPLYPMTGSGSAGSPMIPQPPATPPQGAVTPQSPASYQSPNTPRQSSPMFAGANQPSLAQASPAQLAPQVQILQPISSIRMTR